MLRVVEPLYYGGMGLTCNSEQPFGPLPFLRLIAMAITVENRILFHASMHPCISQAHAYTHDHLRLSVFATFFSCYTVALRRVFSTYLAPLLECIDHRWRHYSMQSQSHTNKAWFVFDFVGASHSCFCIMLAFQISPRLIFPPFFAQYSWPNAGSPCSLICHQNLESCTDNQQISEWPARPPQRIGKYEHLSWHCNVTKLCVDLHSMPNAAQTTATPVTAGRWEEYNDGGEDWTPSFCSQWMHEYRGINYPRVWYYWSTLHNAKPCVEAPFFAWTPGLFISLLYDCMVGTDWPYAWCIYGARLLTRSRRTPNNSARACQGGRDGGKEGEGDKERRVAKEA